MRQVSGPWCSFRHNPGLLVGKENMTKAATVSHQEGVQAGEGHWQ